MAELFGTLGLAFVGGVILNVMPCVLPVLTLKVFHTIESYSEEHSNQKAQALAYTLGTVVFFLALAALVVVLRASGEVLGWGMHFRNPAFVATMVALTFVLGLNALGVFEFFIAAQGPQKTDGLLGGFLTGIFAAVMSTPCSAPFLGTAAGFALAQDTPAWQTMLLFAVIGLGLAFPYTLIGFVPRLGKMLPRPGAWMETFKQIMGFSLLGTAVWLYSVLLNQVTADSATRFLVFLFVIALAAWAIGKFAALRHTPLRRWSVRGGAVLMAALCGVFYVTLDGKAVAAEVQVDPGTIVKDGRINWAPFDEPTLLSVSEKGRLVFLDYTADWCANCKTNEKLFLETDTVRSALVDHNVLPMKVDMTNENAVMDKWLKKVGRSAIPAYAIVFPDGEIDVLPVAITAQLVADRLAAAGDKLKSAS